MSPTDYKARALAIPFDDDEDEATTTRPSLEQSQTFRRPRRTSTPVSLSQMTLLQRWRYQASKAQRRALSHYNKLTTLQKASLILAGLASLALTILILIYNERIFSWLAPIAKKWRDLPFGWLILWGLIFIVSFPPLIGYSTLLSLSGFVYGFPAGWPIVASASLVGSAVAFVVSRYVMQGYVSRLMEHDKRFAALALTIKHDGLKLLVMIRLCPLPYSLSNGALSTIPTVGVGGFALATAIVSPKLLVHVFVGAQLGRLAEHGGEMDAKTKAISYLSIVLGSVLGVATGYIIWQQTSKRAQELEQQEREHVRRESGEQIRAEYADDPGALEAAERLREDVGEDDISLQTEEPWDFEDEDVQEVESYHDSPSEGEDANGKK